jgi:16S rRNA (cytidine1402-2'-O)-methyltransferase
LLTLLPTPIGNIDDIPIRALRVLEEADAVLCEDTRVARKLLRLLAERHGLMHHIDTFISLHSHNERETLASLDPEFFEKNVVYMSDAGMPCISDPGALLVRWCQEREIPYTVVPGPTAFATAYAASGFTDPRFCFFGFLPHKGRAREEALEEALGQRHPVILYEAPHRLEKLLDELAAKAPEREIFAAKELTKRHESFFRGTAEALRKEITGPLRKGEWVLVLAPGEGNTDTLALDETAIAALDLPPKQKAKLLAKATGKSVRECYERLIGE